MQYLGRAGKCVVEDDPTEGWMITYIERDSSMIARKDQRAEKRKEINRALRRKKRTDAAAGRFGALGPASALLAAH